MTSQKSRSSTTSMALVARPRRDDSTDSPALSCLVKISPDRPRAAWLWSIWRARVDLPQSIVPEKKTSSAITQNSTARADGWLTDVGRCRLDLEAVPRGHLQERDRHLCRGQGPMKTQQRQQCRPCSPGVHDREVVTHRHNDVADPRQYMLPDGTEQTLCHCLVPAEHPRPGGQPLAPGCQHIPGGTRFAVQLQRSRLTAHVPDASGQIGVAGEVDPLGMGGIDHAMVGGDMDGGVRGHTGHKTGEAAVDQLQLVAPLPGLAAMDVPHLVELSPVEV